jgi:hypothetical protein
VKSQNLPRSKRKILWEVCIVLISNRIIDEPKCKSCSHSNPKSFIEYYHTIIDQPTQMLKNR